MAVSKVASSPVQPVLVSHFELDLSVLHHSQAMHAKLSWVQYGYVYRLRTSGDGGREGEREGGREEGREGGIGEREGGIGEREGRRKGRRGRDRREGGRRE